MKVNPVAVALWLPVAGFLFFFIVSYILLSMGVIIPWFDG